ncbi:MAG: bifunctional non-ous end joining protein LigD [Betaproteobacteria bacterium]
MASGAKRSVAKRTPAKRSRSRPTKAVAIPYPKALQALDAAQDNVTLDIDGERLTLTRLDKLLWPAYPDAQLPGYTRRDYLRYLLRVGAYLLPHVRDRPLTLIRMPEGITGRRFVHFHYEQRLPPFVQTVMIYSEKNARAEEFLLCNNMATVLWLAHIGTLELHVWHSRTNISPDAKAASTDFASSAESLRGSILNFPDYIVFDLDPYIYSGKEASGAQPEFNVAAFERCKAVAFRLKALLDSMKLSTFVKTSGKTGLHVLVPIVRKVDYDAARAFAQTIGTHLMHQYPDDITLDWNVSRRTGKVFMDYNMNVRVKTLSAPYSVRGLPGAPVSMPLTWEELKSAQPLDYTMRNVAELLAKRGDVWRNLLEAKQDLARILG